MAKNFSDQQILEIMSKPDERQQAVFDWLSDFYEPIISNFARRHGVRDLYVEEVVVETLTGVFVNLSQNKVKLEPTLNAYISKIYLYKTLKYSVRSGKTIQNTYNSIQNSEDSDILQSINTTIELPKDPYAILAEKNLVTLMHQAIGFLEQKCVTLFHLSFDDYSMREIGNQLIKENLLSTDSNVEDATKSQHQRCKQKLKNIIKERFPELVNYYR